MIRLVYQRGDFTPEQTTLVATALFWFAFSLPTNGIYLLQTRTFFSLQRPWMATGLAGFDLVVSTLGALVLYKPFGTGGIVAGTGIGTIAAVIAQAIVLRHEFDGLELRRLVETTVKITIAATLLAAVSFGVWDLLDNALGRGLFGQIVSLGVGLALGGLVYVAAAKLLRIAELEQIMRLLRRR
jgi:putative peptidoglycan lipid II flippase